MKIMRSNLTFGEFWLELGLANLTRETNKSGFGQTYLARLEFQ